MALKLSAILGIDVEAIKQREGGLGYAVEWGSLWTTQRELLVETVAVCVA